MNSDAVHSETRDTESNPTPHISVVCSGNICRSPYGEHKLRALLDQAGWGDKVTVSSSGTLGIVDSGAHSYTVIGAEERGLDLSCHCSQGISRGSIDSTDLLLCMSRGHVNELRELFPEYRDRIFLIGSYPASHLDGPEIGDPIGYELDRFHQVFDEIDQQFERLLPTLISWLSELHCVESGEGPETIS